MPRTTKVWLSQEQQDDLERFTRSRTLAARSLFTVFELFVTRRLGCHQAQYRFLPRPWSRNTRRGAHHPYLAGTVTDLRVIQALVEYMTEHKYGPRITIAEGSGEWLPVERSKSPVDGWKTDWDGAFGDLSYRKMIQEFTRRYPEIKFEIIDLNFDSVSRAARPPAKRRRATIRRECMPFPKRSNSATGSSASRRSRPTR